MARKTSNAPAWIITFADLMSLLVCFFVLIISFSVPDLEKLKIAAGSIRDAFGIQRQVIVTGVVELEGSPLYRFAQDISIVQVEDVVGPIPDRARDISRLAAREDYWEQLIARAEAGSARTPKPQDEDERFRQIEADLRQALAAVPDLARFAEHLQVERTVEGLRIQLLDQARMSMFPLGSARMHAPAKALLRQVAKAIERLPNRISIVGHTDSVAFRMRDGYDNWSLSLDRADATRRFLIASGLDARRLREVVGRADTEHLFPENPQDPRNRRISITLLRDEALPGTSAHGAPRSAGDPGSGS